VSNRGPRNSVIAAATFHAMCNACTAACLGWRVNPLAGRSLHPPLGNFSSGCGFFKAASHFESLPATCAPSANQCSVSVCCLSPLLSEVSISNRAGRSVTACSAVEVCEQGGIAALKIYRLWCFVPAAALWTAAHATYQLVG
jgi:hypothetical protein